LKLVLGLTGPNAAGKGEAADYLRRRGFTVHSLSDIVREEAAAEGFPPEREHLIRIGNRLRAEEGAGVLARRILSRLEERAVVDSIRNPAEVEVLRSIEGFHLLGIRAPMELRFSRSVARSRPGDPVSLEAFESREAEENSSDPGAQQLEAIFRLVDQVIENTGVLDELHHGLDRILDQLELSGPVDPSSSVR